jgi:hypothetical protein
VRSLVSETGEAADAVGTIATAAAAATKPVNHLVRNGSPSVVEGREGDAT